jgi:predicted ester cyclase
MTNRRHLLKLTALGTTSLILGATQIALAASADGAALLERYVAAFNQHDPDAFKDAIAENYVQHNGRSGPGLAALQGLMRGYFQTFPDFHIDVEDRIISGDKVVARNTLTATHSQPVQLGPSGPVFPPTGKKLVWGGIDIWRVAEGKFAEHWDENDFAGLARQLQGK